MVISKKTIKDIDVSNKKVIMRVDFNVPLDKKQQITDDLRIRESMPTINYLVEKKAAVILMSHLGRPDGKVVEEMRMKPIYERLKTFTKAPVKYVNDCIGADAEKAAKTLKAGEILLLENLRFHAEEEKNDAEFAKKLASLADIYVNDAFGTAHRAHASTEGITKHIKIAVAGLLLVKEIDFLANALENPERPFTSIVGGKKVSDKIKVLKRLVEKSDNVIIGGGMAFTFLKAQGKEIGKSVLDEPGLVTAKEVLELAQKTKKTLLLPVDIVVADKFEKDANTKVVSIDAIPADWLGVDIGPKTIEKFAAIIKKSKVCVWNGPLGVFEIEKFAEGTKQIAKVLTETKCKSIVGGGDTAAAVQQFGFSGKMTHISTGGGASLELLEGKKLPGVEALNNK